MNWRKLGKLFIFYFLKKYFWLTKIWSKTGNLSSCCTGFQWIWSYCFFFRSCPALFQRWDFKSLNQSKTRSLRLLDQINGLELKKPTNHLGVFSPKGSIKSSAVDSKFRKIFYISTFKISGIICGVKFY